MSRKVSKTGKASSNPFWSGKGKKDEILCPSCNYGNPNNNNFCGNCGGSLQPIKSASAPAVPAKPETKETPSSPRRTESLANLSTSTEKPTLLRSSESLSRIQAIPRSTSGPRTVETLPPVPPVTPALSLKSSDAPKNNSPVDQKSPDLSVSPAETRVKKEETTISRASGSLKREDSLPRPSFGSRATAPTPPKSPRVEKDQSVSPSSEVASPSPSTPRAIIGRGSFASLAAKQPVDQPQQASTPHKEPKPLPLPTPKDPQQQPTTKEQPIPPKDLLSSPQHHQLSHSPQPNHSSPLHSPNGLSLHTPPLSPRTNKMVTTPQRGRGVGQGANDTPKPTRKIPKVTQNLQQIKGLLETISVAAADGAYLLTKIKRLQDLTDEVVELCSAEFEKRKLSTQLQNYYILDDFEDSILLFVTASKKLSSKCNNLGWLDALIDIVEEIEKLIAKIEAFSFPVDAPPEQSARLSRISTITSTEINFRKSVLLARASQAAGGSRPSGLLPPIPSLPGLPKEPQSQPNPSIPILIIEEDKKQPDLAAVFQGRTARPRTTEISLVQLQEINNPKKIAEQQTLARTSRLSRRSCKLERASRRETAPKWTSEAPMQRAARRSVLLAPIVVPSFAAKTAHGDPSQDNAPKKGARESVARSKRPAQDEEVKQRVSRVSRVLQPKMQRLSVLPPPKQRHALVKKVAPPTVQRPAPLPESESSSEEDDSWSDEDDEIMAAQRAEFAALFGSSVDAMVHEKTDKEFWELNDKCGTLIGKCSEGASTGTYVTRFLCDSVQRVAAQFCTHLRVDADTLDSPSNYKQFDSAEALESLITLFILRAKVLVKDPKNDKLIAEFTKIKTAVDLLLDDLAKEKELNVKNRSSKK